MIKLYQRGNCCEVRVPSVHLILRKIKNWKSICLIFDFKFLFARKLKKIEIIFQFRKLKITKLALLNSDFRFLENNKIEDYFDFFCFNYVWPVPRSQNCKSWQNNSCVTKVQETVPTPIKCEMTNRFLILLIMAQLHPVGFWNHKQDGGGLRSRSGQCSSSCMASSGNFTLTVVLLLRTKACPWPKRFQRNELDFLTGEYALVWTCELMCGVKRHQLLAQENVALSFESVDEIQ